MPVTVDMRGILFPNSSDPIYASNYPNGDRAISGWQLTAGHFEGYMSPLITYPRPDSETAVNSRHRVNYTGEQYRVPIGVEGGAWPFYFELLAGPSGMTIGSQLTLSGGELIADDNYGIITWANSVAGTYTITVRVTDQNNIVNTISWQLVVGTADWLFVDKNAVTNGTGTFASPYNSLAPLLNQTTKKVLFRAGTVDWEERPANLHALPKTYLPYNNESVIMHQAVSSIGAQISGDYWFSGFTFKIPSGRNNIREYDQFFRLEGASRTVFFENIIDLENLSNPNPAGSNSTFLMWTNTGAAQASTDNAWYCVIMKNTFKNIKDRDIFLGYSMRHTVIERNSMENCTTTDGGGHGFYPKTSVDYFTFRGNYSIGTTNTQKLFRMDAYAGYFPMNYYDISYNNYRYYGSDLEGIGIGAISFSNEFIDVGTHHYVYRNTFYAQNAAGIHARGQASTSVILSSNNVLVCGGTNTNGVRLYEYQGTFTHTGYVAGNIASGILDINNKLNGGFVSNLGTKGSQVL